jgi:hypothetical protein
MNFGVGNARHRDLQSQGAYYASSRCSSFGYMYIHMYIPRYDTDLPIYDTETYLLFHHLCMHPTLTQQLVHHSE